MNKKNLITLDMIGHGPIYDQKGSMDFKRNFDCLLGECFTMQIPLARGQSIKYLFSKIKDHGQAPERVSEEKSVTFAHLCRIYKEMYLKDFDLKSFQEESRLEKVQEKDRVPEKSIESFPKLKKEKDWKRNRLKNDRTAGIFTG